VVELLLAHDPRLLELPGLNERTALAAAAGGGHAQVVRELLARGADPRRPRADGASAVYLAARQGHQSVVDVLIERDAGLLQQPVVAPAGALVDLRRALAADYTEAGTRMPAGSSLIEVLILARRAGAAQELLGRHRRLINKAGIGGATPLMLAAATAQPELLSWLLAQGADPGARDHNGDHALLHALERHATECVRLLVEHEPRLLLLSGRGGRVAASLMAVEATAAEPAGAPGLIG
jgi:ankyrin repeat protein